MTCLMAGVTCPIARVDTLDGLTLMDILAGILAHVKAINAKISASGHAEFLCFCLADNGIGLAVALSAAVG